MIWEKKGLIYKPDNSIWWQQHYAILPTPVFLETENILRIYFATTCKKKYGRITFIDVDPQNPSKINNQPKNISLDIGELGSFDDCGVNVSYVIRIEDIWFMYYAGYQRHFRTPYSIFTGLATSDDGENFTRKNISPILERNDKETSLRSAPCIIFNKNDNNYHMWYVSSFSWEIINTVIFDNKMMPLYCIKHGISEDGIHWIVDKDEALTPTGDEFGFGRPYVILDDNGTYKMFYSIRRKNVSYRLGYAESEDGINWIRKDNEVGINVSKEGWDSEMICYPSVITIKNKTYLFYNGNNNGETGFGYAELVNG